MLLHAVIGAVLRMPEQGGMEGHASRWGVQPDTPLTTDKLAPAVLVVQLHILLLKYRHDELHFGATGGRLLNGGGRPSLPPPLEPPLNVIMPPPLGYGALSDDGRLAFICLDVCLSVAYIGPKSRTQRPKKTNNWHRGN